MQKPVKMYTLSTCSHCRAAKNLLDKSLVKYEFTDVDLLTGEERGRIIQEVKQLNAEFSFPTIIIGETVIAGFNEKEIREALGLS